MKSDSTPHQDAILTVKNLKTHFKTDEGIVKAVDGVTFSLRQGERLGLVGESGCGKSVTNLSLLRLIPIPPGKIVGGEVLFHGKDLLKASAKELCSIRGDRISMIFQDPMTSLNPFLKISTQLIETIMLHQNLRKKEAREKAIHMLELVSIPGPRQRIDDYPHQFSGGMRQRVMIAMALSCEPEILIADEPTTGLDVTVQAQILELIATICDERGTSLIMITHDLGVVAGICDRVCVMYAGHIVESADVDTLFETPRHPYTQGLLKSIPRINQKKSEVLYTIPGQPPLLIDIPECCPFFPRCEHAMAKCRSLSPPVISAGDSPKRSVRCWLYQNATKDDKKEGVSHE